MSHYWVMRIASWVILSNLWAKQTAWLFIDTETIFHHPNPSFSSFIAYMLNTAERFIKFFRYMHGSMCKMSNVGCGRMFKIYYTNYQTGNGGCTDLGEHWIISGVIEPFPPPHSQFPPGKMARGKNYYRRVIEPFFPHGKITIVGFPPEKMAI